MDNKNHSVITEVILLGFSNNPKINLMLFFIFLASYLITIFGNLLICFIILSSKNLYIPMYFFLCNLSVIDLCYSSTAVPRFLSDLLFTQRTISNFSCGVQLFLILFLGGTECQLLVLMAYDRFVAICRPLHYPIVMRWSVCYCLTAFVWFFSFLINIVPSFITPMEFCDRNKVNHFMCELVAVSKLSCADISSNELEIVCLSLLSLLLPFALILLSYGCILSSVLQIRSAGRYKAFSTCTSHVVVVFLFFGAGMLTYFGPFSQYSVNQDKYVSIFYVIVCPLLNPLIYSLNNREIKKSLKKKFKNICHPCKNQFKCNIIALRV